MFNEATKFWQDFKRCNLIALESTQPIGDTDEENNRQSKWVPPSARVIKVNWDASINGDKDWVGLGIIAGDSKGYCMGARSITKVARTNPKTAETMATLHAVLFSKEVGFWNVVFEGDEAQVVKELKIDSLCFSKLGHFIDSIQLELQFFRSTSFQAVPRACNMVAHNLARMASSNNVYLCWLEDTPSSVSNIVFFFFSFF